MINCYPQLKSQTGFYTSVLSIRYSALSAQTTSRSASVLWSGGCKARISTKKKEAFAPPFLKCLFFKFTTNAQHPEQAAAE